MPFSKDIDVLLCGHGAVLDDYIQCLKNRFDKKVFIYSKGSDKASLIIQPSQEKAAKNLWYKIDIFCATEETYFSHLLYGTGSKDFNINMRARARRMGLLLNQKGLFKVDGTDVKKINTDTDNERAFFKYLDMEYIEPHNRK
jgi:DNA polymerase/3'-5' exonuclease PolX